MLRPILVTSILSCLFALAAILAASPLASAITSFPTGQRPMGIAVVGNSTLGNFAAVANSGDNSVSIFQLNLTPQSVALTPLVTVTGIPSPYGVFPCGTDIFLVTSPSDNSVRLIKMPQAQIVGTVTTGLQPYSAVCHTPTFVTGVGLTAVVSNLGDSTLTAFDVATLQVKQTIQGVPGSRGYHGLSRRTNSGGITFIAIAATDANLVTELSTSGANIGIVRQIPAPRPVNVVVTTNAGALSIVSATGGSLAVIVTSAINSDLTVTTSQTFPNVTVPRDVIQIGSTLGSGWIATVGDSLWTGFPGNVSAIPGIPEATAIAAISLPPPPGETLGIGGQALLVTSPASNSFFVLYVPTVIPQSQFAAQSAASPQPVAPGSLASSFVAATGVTQEFRAGSLPLPTSLGGVSVSVGGSLSFDWITGQWSNTASGATPAGLLYVGPTQINFQIPPQAAAGSILAQIRKPDGSTMIGMINIVPSSPSIFTLSQNGQGQAAALNQNYSPNSLANPALRGTALQLYLTGAGATSPPLAPGQAADPFGNPLVYTEVQPTVTINAQPATVRFSGMAPGFVGLWQINVEIPQSTPTGFPVPLRVTGGLQSNLVTIAVQ